MQFRAIRTRLRSSAARGLKQVARATVPRRVLQFASSLLVDGPWQAQRAVHTALNRYPEIFSAAAQYFRNTRQGDARPLRILSFGCSTGEECYSLRPYFPDAEIFGCDINDSVLAIAQARQRTGNIAFFRSSPEALQQNGPFDLVFCMSSLCLFPETNTASGEDGKFPFSGFDEMIAGIDQVVRPGGLLVIYNTSYPFSLATASSNYDALQADMVIENGFVNKLHRSGRAFTVTEGKSHAYCQRVVSAPETLTDSDFVDCLFRKKDGKGSQLAVTVSHPLPIDCEVLGTYVLSDEDAFSPAPDLLMGTFEVELLRDTANGLWERVKYRRQSIISGNDAPTKQFVRRAALLHDQSELNTQLP